MFLNFLYNIIEDNSIKQANNYSISIETIYCIILAIAILIIFIYLTIKITNLEEKIKQLEEKKN